MRLGVGLDGYRPQLMTQLTRRLSLSYCRPLAERALMVPLSLYLDWFSRLSHFYSYIASLVVRAFPFHLSPSLARVVSVSAARCPESPSSSISSAWRRKNRRRPPPPQLPSPRPWTTGGASEVAGFSDRTEFICCCCFVFYFPSQASLTDRRGFVIFRHSERDLEDESRAPQVGHRLEHLVGSWSGAQCVASFACLRSRSKVLAIDRFSGPVSQTCCSVISLIFSWWSLISSCRDLLCLLRPNNAAKLDSKEMAPLTIFYNGAVTVFDICPDKVLPKILIELVSQDQHPFIIWNTAAGISGGEHTETCCRSKLKDRRAREQNPRRSFERPAAVAWHSWWRSVPTRIQRVRCYSTREPGSFPQRANDRSVPGFADLPLFRRKSLERFLEKRKER